MSKLRRHSLLGISAEWTPVDLGSKLILWLEALGLVTNTNNEYGIVDGANRVSSWKDLSGNNHHFTQAIGADQPLFDGSDAIDFDGISEYLDGTAHINNFKNNQKGCLIAIQDDSSYQFTMGVIVPAGDNFNTTRFSAVNTKGRYNIRTGGVNRQNAGEVFVPDANHHIVIYQSDGAGGFKIYYDGAEQTPSVSNAGDRWFGDLTNPNGMFIAHWRYSSSLFDDLSTKALLYCNDILTSDEISSLNNYLNSRYTIY